MSHRATLRFVRPPARATDRLTALRRELACIRAEAARIAYGHPSNEAKSLGDEVNDFAGTLDTVLNRLTAEFLDWDAERRAAVA